MTLRHIFDAHELNHIAGNCVAVDRSGDGSDLLHGDGSVLGQNRQLCGLLIPLQDRQGKEHQTATELGLLFYGRCRTRCGRRRCGRKRRHGHGLLHIVVAGGALWRWRRGGLGGFGFAWFAVALLPVSHIVPYVEMVAEHYLYIPLVGIAMIVADGVETIEVRLPEYRWALVAAIVIVATALGVRSVVRNRDWRDGPTLWAATVAVVPDCARARFNLGEVWLRQGKHDEAARLWREGAADFPEAYTYPFSLAKLAYRAGDYDQAYWDIKRAIRIRPQEGEAQSLAGWISLHGGRPRRAIGFFDAAVARLPPAEAAEAAKGRARAEAVVPVARRPQE